MIISFSKLGGGGGGYVLPTATANRLGGVKIGSGVTVSEDGTISVSGSTDLSAYWTSAQTDSAITVAMNAETARTENAYLKTGSLNDYWTSAQTQSAITEATSGITGGLAVYDYDVISGDSTARGELIDLVSGGTQTAVVVKDGVMYYYRGYDEDKYIFVDYKNITFSNNEGRVSFALFYSVKVDASGAEAGTYGQNIEQSLQGFMYTTSDYLKHEVDKNGFLYSSEFSYDVVPGSTPVVGETYTTIYLAITGMVWWGSDFLTVSVNGSDHTIAWWGSKSWFVDGEVYQEDHTTEAGMTVDFSHIDEAGNGYISISASAMTVVAVPNNGEGGGTSTTTPILASANLQMYRNGEWNSVSAVPNLIYSGASEGILASTIAKVKIGLYNGAYAGNDTFYILDGNVSQEAQSIVYTANTGVSETVTLKSTDYTAVIVRTISGDTYSLTLTKNPSLWIGTQQEYDNLPSYDNNTLYVIR